MPDPEIHTTIVVTEAGLRRVATALYALAVAVALIAVAVIVRG